MTSRNAFALSMLFVVAVAEGRGLATRAWTPPLLPPRATKARYATPSAPRSYVRAPQVVRRSTPRWTSSEEVLTPQALPPAAPAQDRLAPQPEPQEMLEASQPEQHVSLGVDLAFLGRRQSTNGGFLGFEWFPGLRLNGRIPITKNWSAKLSLGYFRHGDGTKNFTVAQTLFEAGAAAQYAFYRTGHFKFLAGGVLRGDLRQTTISFNGFESSTPWSLSARVGPQAGILYGIAPDWSLSADFDVTMDLRNARAYTSTAFGVVFYLP